MGLIDGITKIVGIAQEHPIAAAVGTTSAVVGVGLGTAAVVGAVKSRKSSRRKSVSSRKRIHRIKHTKRGWKQDRVRRSKQKWEVAYQKRKKKHSLSSVKHRRGKVYYARKTGQPYIILSSGKAKFIKGKRRKR